MVLMEEQQSCESEGIELTICMRTNKFKMSD